MDHSPVRPLGNHFFDHCGNLLESPPFQGGTTGGCLWCIELLSISEFNPIRKHHINTILIVSHIRIIEMLESRQYPLLFSIGMEKPPPLDYGKFSNQYAKPFLNHTPLNPPLTGGTCFILTPHRSASQHQKRTTADLPGNPSPENGAALPAC